MTKNQRKVLKDAYMKENAPERVPFGDKIKHVINDTDRLTQYIEQAYHEGLHTKEVRIQATPRQYLTKTEKRKVIG